MELRFHINELEVMASVGILPQERRSRQRLIITCSGLISPRSWPLVSLEDSVSYADVAETLRTIALERHWDLLEELLEAQCQALATRFDLLRQLDISLLKPDILADASSVGLTVSWAR